MIDITNLKKDEIIKRAKWKCPYKGHSSHNGLEHSVCYDKDVKGNYQEKVLFFDIEAEDLNADYGIMFNWYAMDDEGNRYEDYITLDDINKFKSSKRDVEPKEDTRIVKSLVALMNKHTRVVGHYSCGYDLPFTRTRAVIDGVDFPAYGMLFQSDTWVFLKKKFKLSRNSLANGCKKLVGHTRKDQLSLAIKHGCLRGEKWAIDDSRKHCRQDVEDLVELYNKTNKYSRKTNTSI
jgi:hypothetical protein